MFVFRGIDARLHESLRQVFDRREVNFMWAGLCDNSTPCILVRYQAEHFQIAFFHPKSLSLRPFQHLWSVIAGCRGRERGDTVPLCGTMVVGMIESWHDTWLKDYFEKDLHSKKIPADLRDRLFRKLQLLDDATVDADLRVPPSNHFEKLGGKLAGRCSIRVSKPMAVDFQME
jgi:toxin HigB-1